MQKKFGTVLDEKILFQTRAFCQREHTTISHLLEEALSEYFQRKKHSSSSFSAIETSFGVLKVSAKALKSILEEDIYETG